MNIDVEKFDEVSRLIISALNEINKKIDRMMNIKDSLDGDKLLDNHDMCALLGVTKRTLARYRHKKLVSYYTIDRRTYYKSSEVKEFLKQKGKLKDTI